MLYHVQGQMNTYDFLAYTAELNSCNSCICHLYARMNHFKSITIALHKTTKANNSKSRQNKKYSIQRKYSSGQYLEKCRKTCLWSSEKKCFKSAKVFENNHFVLNYSRTIYSIILQSYYHVCLHVYETFEM